MSVKFTVAVARASSAVRAGTSVEAACAAHGAGMKADQLRILRQRVEAWVVAAARPRLGYRMDLK